MRLANVFFVDESKVMFKVMVTITKHEIFLPFPPRENPLILHLSVKPQKPKSAGSEILTFGGFSHTAFLRGIFVKECPIPVVFFPLWAKDSPMIKGVKE